MKISDLFKLEPTLDVVIQDDWYGKNMPYSFKIEDNRLVIKTNVTDYSAEVFDEYETLDEVFAEYNGRRE